MKYQYNFGFLSDWLKANPNIKKNDILKAFGIKADSGIKKWIECEYTMPVISMLRFCNTFNVPLSVFFRDSDAIDKTTLILYPPTDNDILVPRGGYVKARERGGHSLFDPLDVTITPSVVPGLVTNDEKKDRKETQEPLASVINKKEQVSISDIISLELKHKDQVGRLLDIISKQQKLIEDMAKSHK